MLKTLYHEILYRLPKKIAHKIIYFRVFHKKLNLTAPQDLNEKIHYLIIHKYGEKEAQLSDKIAVKEILAKKKIPHLNIIKTIKTYDDATKIDFEELGTQFVLKCNHGSGDVIVCKDKKNLDIEKVRRKIEKSLKNKENLV